MAHVQLQNFLGHSLSSSKHLQLNKQARVLISYFTHFTLVENVNVKEDTLARVSVGFSNVWTFCCDILKSGKSHSFKILSTSDATEILPILTLKHELDTFDPCVSVPTLSCVNIFPKRKRKNQVNLLTCQVVLMLVLRTDIECKKQAKN